MKLPDYDVYAVLGVKPNANLATIRRAHRACVRHAHPDRRPQADAARAHEDMVRINLAWAVLSDPRLRAEYDAGRAAKPKSQPTHGSPPRREPPPRPRPRVVVVKPQVVDFGSVVVGEIPPDQVVMVSLSDDSTIRYAWVLNDRGDFWQVVEPRPCRDVSAVRLRLRVRPLSPHDGLGPRHDRLRLVVEDLIVVVPVCINVVEPAPPPPPRPKPPRRPASPPPRPTRSQPSPEPKTSPPPRQGRPHIGCGLASLLIVLVAVVAGFVVNARHELPARESAHPDHYCSVALDDGQVLGYYATIPGTDTKTGPELWDSPLQRGGDPWVAWWTPAFPYWERANKHNGFEFDGNSYHQYERIEVLVVREQGWDPLTGLFRRHPGLNRAAESAQRAEFLGEWVKHLEDSTCG
ncbi:DnaJ-like protein [Streptomyces sp. Ag109_G2-6]|uniref:J domain-containing protein n=1 Tax=Streptomyces TaxID=1883 RepID=UPI0009A552F2|nr:MULTISPECIES: J domain-containing protein [Streptomyces]RPF40769.1 DnaJ-like protein [Streptomyces sp. Ag109_G2-6]